jgi:hypothetical protein
MQSQSIDEDGSTAAQARADAQTEKSIREILELLPADVVEELNRGVIDLKDPAFLEGLADHVSRLSLADPRNGKRIIAKFVKLKKRIRQSLRESDPDVVTSATVARSGPRVGRNEKCPCGSGRKYKQCCMRKTASGES